MTTSTARFRFEFRVFDWAETLSRDLCGERCSFFIGIREDGSVRRLYFARGDVSFSGDRKSALAESHPVWFFYSPHDDLGAGYLEWFNLPRSLVERWLKRRLEAHDFIDVRATGAREEWPENWRVLIG
ncbi:MAG: hypothetical protein HN348_29705 [Proteobacteria bacterium]|nr:hypothetical protein [Pseudomonadota bacterium]